MSETEKLLNSAKEQWSTVRSLMELAPLEGDARRSVMQQAERCRTSLVQRRAQTPMAPDPQAEIVEELSQVLEDVIDDAVNAA